MGQSTTVTKTKYWTIKKTNKLIGQSQISFEYVSLNKTAKSVMVLPVTSDNKIIFVKKFCPALDTYELVLPGGKIENQLSANNTAHKELIEETGFDCKSLRSVGKFKILPAYLQGVTFGFIASKLFKSAKYKIDKSEHLTVVEISINKTLSLIKNGAIRDVRTTAIILYYLNFVQGHV